VVAGMKDRGGKAPHQILPPVIADGAQRPDKPEVFSTYDRVLENVTGLPQTDIEKCIFVGAALCGAKYGVLPERYAFTCEDLEAELDLCGKRPPNSTWLRLSKSVSVLGRSSLYCPVKKRLTRTLWEVFLALLCCSTSCILYTVERNACAFDITQVPVLIASLALVAIGTRIATTWLAGHLPKASVWVPVAYLAALVHLAFLVLFLAAADTDSSLALFLAMFLVAVLVYLVWPMLLGWWMLEVVTGLYILKRVQVATSSRGNEQQHDEASGDWERVKSGKSKQSTRQGQSWDQVLDMGWDEDEILVGEEGREQALRSKDVVLFMDEDATSSNKKKEKKEKKDNKEKKDDHDNNEEKERKDNKDKKERKERKENKGKKERKERKEKKEKKENKDKYKYKEEDNDQHEKNVKVGETCTVLEADSTEREKERKESWKEDAEGRGSQVPKQKVKIQKKKEKKTKKKDTSLEFEETEKEGVVVENTKSVKDKVKVKKKKQKDVEFVENGEERVMKKNTTSVEECKNVDTNKKAQKVKSSASKSSAAGHKAKSEGASRP